MIRTAKTLRTPRTHVVILSITVTGGTCYLGNIGCGNQGVSRISNANVYTERGARNIAAQYSHAVVAPHPERGNILPARGR